MTTALQILALTTMLVAPSRAPATPAPLPAAPFPVETPIAITYTRVSNRRREDGSDDDKASQPIGGDGPGYDGMFSTIKRTKPFQYPANASELETLARLREQTRDPVCEFSDGGTYLERMPMRSIAVMSDRRGTSSYENAALDYGSVRTSPSNDGPATAGDISALRQHLAARRLG